ncbi:MULTISPECIES: TadE family protein [Catenuloplanes]|uniref:Flp pilus assembly protein TadG n=1 Tax=Catenuloplanes niger TaxID=587534 RepID=A0AAE3ZN23_9ACTN|nr:pilus assembly protein [Catenuloplanes niger]MDR7322231.1 Flp pilus assembly protein TadG [Catenuloplanes niger]
MLRSQRGASPVELAILMPVILFMLFGGIQVAAVYMARATALAAAQEAVSAERLFQAKDGSGKQRADAFIRAAGDWLTGPTVTVTKTGTDVTCVVTGNALSIIPGWTIPVTQTATGPRERVTAGGGG